jgi:hypothetical protein
MSTTFVILMAVRIVAEAFADVEDCACRQMGNKNGNRNTIK